MSTLNWSKKLRDAISTQSATYAASLPIGNSYLSLGLSTRLYTPFNNGTRHGNFCDASYGAILANPDWGQRLNKPHQRRNSLPTPQGDLARELDSANSSDALLMNIFCYPNVLDSELSDLLGVNSTATPIFGFKAEVPLANGNVDRTEIDLTFENVIIEAKFTEKDFTQKSEDVVLSYKDLDAVFHVTLLPRIGTDFKSYQLIRNVLAAHHHNCRFLLLCDARRPDLIQAWCEIYAAIKVPELQARCGFILWQQIVYVCPIPLADYLHQSRSIV